jgi:hypothetical protein
MQVENPVLFRVPCCAWFDIDNHTCTHSANLPGSCKKFNKIYEFPKKTISPCKDIHLVGHHYNEEKIDATFLCACGTPFSKVLLEKYVKIYKEFVRRGIVVCCRCHERRVRGIRGTWTEAALKQFQAAVHNSSIINLEIQDR